jgi:O-antigen/teichoic acid export membrane protein
VHAARPFVGLAVASMAANALALLFTVIFARLLGSDGYGSLAALVSALLVLSVPGTALQVAVARDVAAGRYGSGPALAATLRAWLRPLLALGVAAILLSALARDLVAAAVGVREAWAAATLLPGTVAWLVLSVLRGTLQATGATAPVVPRCPSRSPPPPSPSSCAAGCRAETRPRAARCAGSWTVPGPRWRG